MLKHFKILIFLLFNSIVLFSSVPDDRDIIISSVNVPNSAIRGGQITIRYTVKTIGTNNSNFLNLYYGYNSVWLSKSQNNSIGNNDILIKTNELTSYIGGTSSYSITYSIPSDLPLGNYFINFKANSTGSIPEAKSKTSNNTFHHAIQINEESKPDLIVKESPFLDNSSTIPIYNSLGTYSINVIAENIGEAVAPGSEISIFFSRYDELFSGDQRTLRGTIEVPEIQPNSTSSELNGLMTIPSKQEVGNEAPELWYIHFLIDYNDEVDEEYEDNNVKSYPVNVQLPSRIDPIGPGPIEPRINYLNSTSSLIAIKDSNNNIIWSKNSNNEVQINRLDKGNYIFIHKDENSNLKARKVFKY